MPYPNEHAARINDPDKYDSIRRENDHFGSGIDVIWGIIDGKAEIQAIRFDKNKFTVSEAKKWLRDHDFSPILFEPASASQGLSENVITALPTQVKYGVRHSNIVSMTKNEKPLKVSGCELAQVILVPKGFQAESFTEGTTTVDTVDFPPNLYPSPDSEKPFVIPGANFDYIEFVPPGFKEESKMADNPEGAPAPEDAPTEVPPQKETPTKEPAATENISEELSAANAKVTELEAALAVKVDELGILRKELESTQKELSELQKLQKEAQEASRQEQLSALAEKRIEAGIVGREDLDKEIVRLGALSDETLAVLEEDADHLLPETEGDPVELSGVPPVDETDEDKAREDFRELVFGHRGAPKDKDDKPE